MLCPLDLLDLSKTMLAKELPNLRIFYEQKSNLTFEQVLMLKRAGVWLIQPGIESLSTAMLQRKESQ